MGDRGKGREGWVKESFREGRNLRRVVHGILNVDDFDVLKRGEEALFP